MIKAPKKLGIERTYLNILKTIYDKLIVTIVLNGEKLKPFLLQSGRRQGYPLSSVLLNLVLEFPPRPIRQEKEIKRFK
jgi:hypothetical protein